MDRYELFDADVVPAIIQILNPSVSEVMYIDYRYILMT